MAGVDGRYQVARSTGRCESSGVELPPGTTCIAALCDDSESDGFRRIDYSLEAWEGGARPEALFSHWRTSVPESNARQRILVGDDVLIDLLERLEGEEKPKRQAFRFVIALVLLRKRLVRFDRREETPEGVMWHLSGRGEVQDTWTVLDPSLGDDDIVDLHEQLGEVLQGDL